MIQTLPRYTDTYQQNLQFNEQFLLWHVYSIMLAPAQRQPVIEDINIFAVQDVKYFFRNFIPELKPRYICAVPFMCCWILRLDCFRYFMVSYFKIINLYDHKFKFINMRLRLISICQQFSIHVMDFRNSCSIICTNNIYHWHSAFRQPYPHLYSEKIFKFRTFSPNTLRLKSALVFCFFCVSNSVLSQHRLYNHNDHCIPIEGMHGAGSWPGRR